MGWARGQASFLMKLRPALKPSSPRSWAFIENRRRPGWRAPGLLCAQPSGGTDQPHCGAVAVGGTPHLSNDSSAGGSVSRMSLPAAPG